MYRIYKVTVTSRGFIVSVHHHVPAESADAACELAKVWHPPFNTYVFRAEVA